FISTHFMNEAERCDRISLMHAGRVLVSDEPAALIEQRGVETLEDAFIAWLEEAVEETEEGASAAPEAAETPSAGTRPGEVEAPPGQRAFDLRRLFSYARRESLELRRDPIRATMALLGSVILMFIIGY